MNQILAMKIEYSGGGGIIFSDWNYKKKKLRKISTFEAKEDLSFAKNHE